MARRRGCVVGAVGAGSVGCGGLIGGGLALVVAGVGAAFAGLWWVQARWEESLRSAVRVATGGEAEFEGLTLGLRRVTVRGLRVSAPGGAEALRVDALTLDGDPWLFSTEEVPLDALTLEGVRVILARDGPDWDVPPGVAALLAGADRGFRTPQLRAGSVRVIGATIEVRSPDGAWSVAIGEAALEGLSAGLTPGLDLTLGAVAIPELSIEAAGAETVRARGVAFEPPPLAWPIGAIGLESVRVDGLAASLGPAGWGLPAVIERTLVGGSGVSWPEIAVGSVAIGAVRVDAAADGSRAVLSTGGVEVGPTRLALSDTLVVAPGPIVARSVRLDDSVGGRLLETPRAALSVAPFTHGDRRVVVSELVVGQARTRVSKSAALFGARPALALVRLSGRAWDGVEVRAARVDAMSAAVVGAGGALDAEMAEVRASGLLVSPASNPPWRLVEARVGAGSVREGERAVARWDGATLESGGALLVRGAEAWSRATPERLLELPPVVEDHAPIWAGGRLNGGATAWFGVDLTELPWRPTRLVADGAQLHLDDRRFAVGGIAWVVSLASARIGPIAGDVLPVRASGSVNGAPLVLDARVHRAGRLDGTLAIDDLPLTSLAPYASGPLDKHGLVLESGTTRVAADVRLDGSRVAIDGTARVDGLALTGTSTRGRALATAHRAVGARTVERLTLPVAIHGDLADPGFSPVSLAMQGAVGSLVGQLEGRASGVVGAGADALVGEGTVGREAAQSVVRGAETVGGTAKEAVGKVGDALGLKKKAKPDRSD